MVARDSGDSGYEQVISELHDVASELAQMESREAICHRILDAAESLLDFDLSIVALEEDGRLHPKAVSSGLQPDEFEAMSIHEGIAGKTYRTGESYLIKDMTEWEEATPQGAWMSGISLPIGAYGNFQAVNEEIGAFDEQDLRLAELLITHASHHLDRIANKEELERQNDRLEEFANVVSHDLRNPLNVAHGRLELAREECDSEHFDQIDTAIDRMNRIIEDVLWLAREGRDIGSTEPVEIQDVVESAWNLVADSVDRAELRYASNEDRLPSVRADYDRLCQLLENLLRNAIEHGGDDVTITVGAFDDGFYIEDDGPGLPKEERKNVLETGYSTSEEGTGFGLSIVKQIAQAHDWNVCVTDGSDGGARFEITGVEFITE